MSWYFVDPSGSTLGPMSVDLMKPNWSKTITEETYVWNGADVSQWTPLKDVPQLLKQLKPNKPAYPVPPPNPRMTPPPLKTAPAVKKSVGGGRAKIFGRKKGGRANLLASIRKGNNLKKVAAVKSEGPGSAGPGARYGGGGGGGGNSKFGGGKLTLQQQMAQKLAKRNKASTSFAHLEKNSTPTKTVKKTTPSWKRKKPGENSSISSSTVKKQPSWKTKNNNSSGSSWKNKKKNAMANSATSPSSAPKNTVNASPAKNTTRIVDALESAQPWQLMAIEKILDL